jgi:polyisoprenoid-binding protein YceI
MTTRPITYLFLAGLAISSLQAQTPAPAPPAAPQARPQPAPLGPNEWRIDSNHSAANFSVKHLMVSTVRGQLGAISGTLHYDGKDVRSIKADISVDIKGLSTQNGRRDEHLRTADFFDVATHPALTFKSKRVEPGADGRFKLIGDLTIRGTTREVALDVEGPAPVTKTQQGVATGATATTRINRLDYGLKWNNMVEAGPVVSNEVTVTIDLEANRPAGS